MTDAARPTERFSSRVADYARYRPGYPPAMLAWLYAAHGVTPAWRVADIGAGTGISTRVFLEAGHPVAAVEPNGPMRAALERDLAGFAQLRVIAGTAEATTLAEAGIDLVSAAQAFHWFDQDAVRHEWRRILHPGGLAAVYWNSRLLEGAPFLQRYEALLGEYGTDYSAVAERYNDDASMRAWFGAGFRGMAVFDNHQWLDFDQLRGRLLSSSYAPQAGHPRHGPMLEALQRLFDATAIDGRVDFAYKTRIFVGMLH